MPLFRGPGRIAASSNIANRNLCFIIYGEQSTDRSSSGSVGTYGLPSVSDPSKIREHAQLFQSCRSEKLFRLCPTIASLERSGKPIELVVNTGTERITRILP